ncbi:peptidoglycan-binding protein [Streptomyces luteocolor]|uniref:peptidoglycan-binding protein n=1 Tax=Streptomyces luteocolor TaxID=285500 RepID=UPI000A7E44D2|nr:peptidoglycan-binding domain-containing protein [Streptomyces luteocolor]
MNPDENGGPAVSGEPSGALERRGSGRLSTRTAGTLDTAVEEETAVAQKPAAETEPSAEEPGDGSGPPTGRRRRPLRTSLLVLVAIAVAAAAGLAATGALGGDGEDSAGSAPSGPPATAKVERTTLTDTQTVDGNLGYGDPTAVQAPAGSSGASGDQSSGSGRAGQDSASGNGIVTWVPEEGAVLKRGDTVYRVDQQKVPLLYGSFPLYRTLKSGTEGADVEMLEKNLRALGYTGFDVDDTYNSATAEAVKEWQDDLNRKETGTVEPGDAQVADGARRVADVKASAGAALSGTLLTWTGTERTIGVDLDVQYEDLVEKGTKATVKLPDDTTVQAEVTDVGTPSTAQGDSSGSGSDDSGSGNSDSSKDPTLPVELKVKDQKGLGRYQAAAVEVTLKAETRKDVLVVPVNALVARQGGGYALEVVTADGTEYRPVKLGMFADSRVEVSGTGIKEGTVVGVPK